MSQSTHQRQQHTSKSFLLFFLGFLSFQQPLSTTTSCCCTAFTPTFTTNRRSSQSLTSSSLDQQRRFLRKVFESSSSLVVSRRTSRLSSTLQPPSQPPSHQNHNRHNHFGNHTDSSSPLPIIPASVVLNSKPQTLQQQQQPSSYDSCLFTYSCPRRQQQQQQDQPLSTPKAEQQHALYFYQEPKETLITPPLIVNNTNTVNNTNNNKNRKMKFHRTTLSLMMALTALASSGTVSASTAPKPKAVFHKAKNYIQQQDVTVSFDDKKKAAKSPVIRMTSPEKVVKWGCLLTAMAGYCNGAFMSGFMKLLPKQGVAAVTGAWTNSAIGAASSTTKLFVGQSSVIASFIVGSMIYGLINPRPKQLELGRKQTSVTLTLISSCLLGAIWILDHATNNDRAAAFEVCCLVALASGIQNSLTSSITGNLCRTTHYTGISSDMGTFLGQVLRGNTANLFKLQTFAKLAACFWLGGYGAFFAAQKFGADALLLPVGVNLLLAFYTQFVHKA